MKAKDGREEKTRRAKKHFIALMMLHASSEYLQAMFAHIVELYSQEHRAYHNWRHILASIDAAEEFFGEEVWLTKPELMLAIIYHDIVYDPKASDNEDKSKEMAAFSLRYGKARPDFIAKVERLIIATRHTEPPHDEDEAAIIDIDLAILGKPWERFYQYELQIREEYHFVPWADYVEGRTKILQMFLFRERIYTSEYFHQRYEVTARKNIERAISLLHSNQS